MRADDWIIDYLVKKGVTDVFGIPGVVVMDFLYAVDRRKPEITPHLSYHEQGGAFAACGYAQATGKVGVAYGTRGPGMTNMITAIADAYYDSTPTMFFTAHSSPELKENMRVLNNQEIDTVSLVKNVTKMAVRIDSLEDLQREVMGAYHLASTGRRGPVFLDILSSLFGKEVEEAEDPIADLTASKASAAAAAVEIRNRIKAARCPVLLVGSGTRYGAAPALIRQVAAKFGIPILSSRTAQDVVPDSAEYFGFVGSRATRYSNFILSKADLIIALGNRMAFPTQSKSFRPVVENAFTIRVDVDGSEFTRPVPNSIGFTADVSDVLAELVNSDLHYENAQAWLDICRELKQTLNRWDEIPVISRIMGIIEASDPGSALVCDVGNHSFWVTSAHAYCGRPNRILYSGSFGTLGCALPKAIGACYSTGHPSVCFVGDQGLQMNIQELQFISANRLPMTIVVLNNRSSGMIMEREKAKHGDYFVHTTLDSGYSYPDYEAIAKAYKLDYRRVNAMDLREPLDVTLGKAPLMLELMVDEDTALNPNLPQGNACQDLAPALPKDLYDRLNNL